MLFTGWDGLSLSLSDPSPFVEMGSPVFNMACEGRGERNHQEVDQSANGARRFLVVVVGGADAAWFGWFRRE